MQPAICCGYGHHRVTMQAERNFALELMRRSREQIVGTAPEAGAYSIAMSIDAPLARVCATTQ
jgi:hypothetical protein